MRGTHTERPDGLRAAAATLARATGFLGAGMQAPEDRRSEMSPSAITGPFRAKVIGNGLRELDRFLNLLTDEIAADILHPESDHPGFSRQRNTANKVRTLRSALALPNPDHDRLRAIGRSRDCLFHCAGIVRRADTRTGRSMTSGWMGSGGTGAPVPRRFAMGERLIITAADLAHICRFYDRIASELVAAWEARPQRIA